MADEPSGEYSPEFLQYLRSYGPGMESKFMGNLQTLSKDPNYASVPNPQVRAQMMTKQAALLAKQQSQDELKAQMEKYNVKQLDPVLLRKSLLKDNQNYEPSDDVILQTGQSREALKKDYAANLAPVKTEKEYQSIIKYMQPPQKTVEMAPEEIQGATGPEGAPVKRAAAPRNEIMDFMAGQHKKWAKQFPDGSQWSTPDLSVPRVATPGVAAPGVNAPGVAAPGVNTPGPNVPNNAPKVGQ